LALPDAAAGRNQGFEKLMKRPRAISHQLSAQKKYFGQVIDII
jgi:hypothetical protein